MPRDAGVVPRRILPLVLLLVVAATATAVLAAPSRAHAEPDVREYPWEVSCGGAETHATYDRQGNFTGIAQVIFRAQFVLVTDGVTRWLKAAPVEVVDPIEFPGTYIDVSRHWVTVEGSKVSIHATGSFISTDVLQDFIINVTCTNSFNLDDANLDPPLMEMGP